MSTNPIFVDPSADHAALLAQLRPALVRFFRRRSGSRTEAEDLAQDVMVRALSHADWTSHEEARGYIFRIAINLWRDRQRHQLVKGGTELHWNDDVALGVTEEIPLERVLTGEEELQRVHAALLELSARTRDVFMLIRFEQMKYSAVAEMLGISVSAVDKHVAKALAHLALRTGRMEDSP
jgi:RNA polymerase sigma-70 factor (ECF subfamily)